MSRLQTFKKALNGDVDCINEVKDDFGAFYKLYLREISMASSIVWNEELRKALEKDGSGSFEFDLYEIIGSENKRMILLSLSAVDLYSAYSGEKELFYRNLSNLFTESLIEYIEETGLFNIVDCCYFNGRKIK